MEFAEMSGFAALAAVFGAFFFFFFIVAAVLYVLLAAGLYKLALNKEIESAWLAWVPFGNLYILGKIVGDFKIGEWKVPCPEQFLFVGSIVTFIVSFIPVIGFLARIAFLVVFFFALYNLYKIYRPLQAMVWLVLSIILSFLIPVFVFIMRNDLPVLDSGTKKLN